MGEIEALILGLVQGLTEFLPVSSSGHLQIGQHLLGVTETGGLTFDIVVHVATVLATVTIFRKEIWDLICGFFKKLNPDKNLTLWNRLNDAQRYVVLIVISMIPIGIVGLCFKDKVEEIFASSIVVVGVCLIVTSALLALTHFFKTDEKTEKKEISPLHAFIIGLAQSVAVLPGLSRSGSTIATGLLLGNKRENVAQFSFLMVIPPILGEALLDFKHIFAPSAEYLAEHGASSPTPALALIVGFVAAFISGCFACKWMVQLIKKCKLIYFAIYCFIMGIVCITLL
ncbi:MAG: undecaprenyl-diphosphatase UppP [Bacteroidales bacterium]|nr:undecaprenyl-diphosphatase UppP [Bacteroidales bacterium]